MGDSHGPDRSCSLKWGEPALRGSTWWQPGIRSHSLSPHRVTTHCRTQQEARAGSSGKASWDTEQRGEGWRVGLGIQRTFRSPEHCPKYFTCIHSPNPHHGQGQVEQYALFNLFLLSFSLFGWVHT